MKPKISQEMLQKARALRTNMTDAEKKLWLNLRGRQMCGLKFRRQHPLGPYIVDFYCHQARLVIEVDGGQHWDEENRRYDARRTAYLHMQAIRVIRFSNDEVLKDTEGVLEHIQQVLEPPRKELDGLGTPPPSLPRPVA